MPPLPPEFRGSVCSGQEAAERASLVSGPFRATPLAYVTPEDENALCHLLRWAWHEEIPVTPRGGGTGMPGGNLGSAVIVQLGPGFMGKATLDSGRGLHRLGVGVVADAAEQHAKQHNHFLPFLPSSSPWCRIGGVVANNAAGARSFRYGATAAWVHAIEGVFAWGEPFRVGRDLPIPPPFESLRVQLTAKVGEHPAGWPEVRKNSSGYALDRFLHSGDPAQLLVGSEGTLAVITCAEIRSARTPRVRGLAVLPARSAPDVREIALGSALQETTTCEFLGRRFLDFANLGSDPEVGVLTEGAYALLLIEVEGTTLDEVDEKLQSVQTLGAQAGGRGLSTRDPETVERLWDLRHRASPMIAALADEGRISTQFIEDSVVPPKTLDALLDGLDQILHSVGFDAVTFGHAGDGNVHVNPLVDVASPDWKPRVRQTMDEVAHLVRSLGGTLSGEHGDGRIRAPFISKIWPGNLVEAFRDVKHSLDSRGILNPGVILPVPGQDPLDGFEPRKRTFPV